MEIMGYSAEREKDRLSIDNLYIYIYNSKRNMPYKQCGKEEVGKTKCRHVANS
jgi:hypothetical protein